MVVGGHQYQAKHHEIVSGAGAENPVRRYLIIYLVQDLVVVVVLHQHIMNAVQHRLAEITSVQIRIFRMMMIMRKS